MAEGLTAILITAVLILIIIAVAVAIMNYVIPKLTPPIGQIVNIIMWGIIAILVIVYILVPLIRLLPGTVG